MVKEKCQSDYSNVSVQELRKEIKMDIKIREWKIEDKIGAGRKSEYCSEYEISSSGSKVYERGLKKLTFYAYMAQE